MLQNRQTIQKILNLGEDLAVTPEEMLKIVKIAFYPFDRSKISSQVLGFYDEFRQALSELNVEIIEFEDTLIVLPWRKKIKWLLFSLIGSALEPFQKFFKREEPLVKHLRFGLLWRSLRRKKIKPGVTIVALGESETGNLPMDHVASFRHNPVITLVDMPPGISDQTGFEEHFSTSMRLFIHHMSHIVIGVDDDKFILYNLNAAHPIFPRADLKANMLSAILPKIAAPIMPLRLSQVSIVENAFSVDNPAYAPLIKDLEEGSRLFGGTDLFPRGKSVAELPFRNDYYLWAGKMHLDQRTGMSYGFIAKQMPFEPLKLSSPEEFAQSSGLAVEDLPEYFIHDNVPYLKITALKQAFIIELPEVDVLAQRSGSDKTNFNPRKDLQMLSIKDGQIYLKIPSGIRITNSYRPSYDTKVILAHALGNALISSILGYFRPGNAFTENLKRNGLAIIHWHGYLNDKHVPAGWQVFGQKNPHVACSTAQSAYYTLESKLQSFASALESGQEYLGDVHIEPHHGTNMTYPSITALADFFLGVPDSTELGNKYLKL